MLAEPSALFANSTGARKMPDRSGAIKISGLTRLDSTTPEYSASTQERSMSIPEQHITSSGLLAELHKSASAPEIFEHPQSEYD